MIDAIFVKILNEDTIIYGKGNKLILRTQEPTGCIKHVTCSTEFFDKVHEISSVEKRYGEHFIACSAGRELLYGTIANGTFKHFMVVKICDWISSVKVLDDESIAIITAHNLAALIITKGNQAVIKETLRCEENSTLYCSHILGESTWENLTFLIATALGELVVWKKKNEPAKQIILRKFLHNGVVFSIDCNNNYLVTSSDDRSIKVFELRSDEEFGIEEKLQLFGHTSRVFVCRIIEFNSVIYFLSAGEDSNLCVWNEKGDLLTKRNINASGIIWNLDYNASLEYILTCSSSGKLNKFQMVEILFKNHTKESFHPTENLQPMKLAWMKSGALVVIDNLMQIHVKPLLQVWQKVDHPKNPEKFVAMEVWENRLFLAAKYSIVVFDFLEDYLNLCFTTEISIKQLLPSSINLDCLRSIHAISTSRVAICDKNGECFVLDVVKRKILHHFTVPTCSEPWTTAVVPVNQMNEFWWLIGDRVGNLFLFESHTDLTKISTPVQKLWKLHGKLGVTTINIEADGFVKTTGNDGTVKTLFINQKTSPPTIEIHRTERTPINWIEKVWQFNGREVLLGFNDNYFAMCHKQQIIYEHRCGGRRRHWDISILRDNRILFTYIHKKQLNFVEFLLSDYSLNDVTSSTWHTKDCNVIVRYDKNLLVSGGEDTLIKLTRINIINGEPCFEEIATVNSHVSSVKTIAVFQDDEDLLIFSAGGRAQIVVTRLIKLAHVKEEINLILTKGKSKESTFDAETRITSIFYESELRNLFVACSDGYFRIFNFSQMDENGFGLNIIAEQFYGKCILKIAVVERFILTMGTDGFVCFWELDGLSNNLRLIDKLKHNKSGINCFDIYNCGGCTYMIGTSGDDSGVFVTEFTIEGSKVFFRETVFNNEIHIAQVTGLKFMSRTVFCTTSIDQTVARLEVLNSKAIKIVGKKFTCVSDVKGFLCLDDDEHIVVYGAGLEVVKFV